MERLGIGAGARFRSGSSDKEIDCDAVGKAIPNLASECKWLRENGLNDCHLILLPLAEGGSYQHHYLLNVARRPSLTPRLDHASGISIPIEYT